MRNPTLHGLLEAFTADAAARLSLATEAGDELPFEVVASGGSRRGAGVPLYCYRPLTGKFIGERLGLLVALTSYAPVARALEIAEGTEAYLIARAEDHIPARPRERADAALRCFLARVFAERSGFAFESQQFDAAYEELERALYQGQCVFEVVTQLLGVALDVGTDELAIGDGLSLVRAGALAEPPELEAWEGARREPREPSDDDSLLILLRCSQPRERPPLGLARTRFRRVLTALRLFEPGGFALGSIGAVRIDGGAWRPVALGGAGRPRTPVVIPAAQEDEFRGFCNLIARRLAVPDAAGSGAGELAWALARFEMGCERVAPFEALTDYLLALRALLEPEGPSSGRLAGRLAAICAASADRAALAQRTAYAVSLERAVVTGIAPAIDPDCSADGLVEELGEHLRAILRDTVCGHLDSDLRSVADELLAQALDAVAA